MVTDIIRALYYEKLFFFFFKNFRRFVVSIYTILFLKMFLSIIYLLILLLPIAFNSDIWR